MPTGLSAEVSSECARSQQQAAEKAIRLLKSRIYAKTKLNPPFNAPQSGYVYDLPDCEQFPNDLGEYKQLDNSSAEVGCVGAASCKIVSQISG